MRAYIYIERERGSEGGGDREQNPVLDYVIYEKIELLVMDYLIQILLISGDTLDNNNKRNQKFFL